MLQKYKYYSEFHCFGNNIFFRNPGEGLGCGISSVCMSKNYYFFISCALISFGMSL